MLSEKEVDQIIGGLVRERSEREIRMAAAKVKLSKFGELLKFFGGSLNNTVHDVPATAAYGRSDAERYLQDPPAWDEVRKAYSDYIEESDRLAEINESLKQMGVR